MRMIPPMLAFTLMTVFNNSAMAQAIAPEKSAKAAAANDNMLIRNNIRYYQDLLFFTQKAIDRSSNNDIKELAQEMLTDNSAMLYNMEELASAGSGASGQKAAEETTQQAIDLNTRFSKVSASDFDTLWVSGLLKMNQEKYDELMLAKETVTNPRLKAGIVEALPLIRKHLTQLKRMQKEQIKLALQIKKEAAKKKAVK